MPRKKKVEQQTPPVITEAYLKRLEALESAYREKTVMVKEPETTDSTSPVLMMNLLRAKAELMQAMTPNGFNIVKDIMALETNLPAKVTIAASAILKAKALAAKHESGGAIHPDEALEVIKAFTNL